MLYQLQFLRNKYFNKEAHKARWENKLWIMFDRARKQYPSDYLLSWAILMEIDRLNE